MLASGVARAVLAHPVELQGCASATGSASAPGSTRTALAIEGWAALGFGFVELGTVTPRPQPGNPRPRLFRLPQDEALINRMGFNNAGAERSGAPHRGAGRDCPAGFVIGVNIGRNRDTPTAGDRRLRRRRTAAVADVADYMAVNVSSPNTPGLRDLQEPERLRELLARGPRAPLPDRRSS